MEKDNFKDRTKETTMHSCIRPGMMAFICEKNAQKYAKEMSDLTCVEITQILTKHDHPRGIKVKGILYEQIGNRYRKTDKEAVGRIVYLAEKEV